jgi:hypothetical protein
LSVDAVQPGSKSKIDQTAREAASDVGFGDIVAADLDALANSGHGLRRA